MSIGYSKFDLLLIVYLLLTFNIMIDIGISSSLFSSYFTTTFVGPEELTANEKLLTTKFADKRLKDFSTGRFCARKAMELIGYEPCEILMGTDKQPIWPKGIVGSISHTSKLTGAVVGLNGQIRAIGVDIEAIGKINTEMWRLLYTEKEKDLLNSLPPEQIAYYTTLFFSFKESFYKMQHPLTNTYLDFIDVEISRLDDQFIIKVLKQFSESNLLPTATSLHYQQEKNQIITWCYLV